MGMFDYYRVSGPAFVCSEGHDLTGEEFQGKSLSCTLASHKIDGDRLTLGAGYSNKTEALPHYTTTIFVGSQCPRCPAFLQAHTYNIFHTYVDFAVAVEGRTGRVLAIERCSETTAEFLRTTPLLESMAGGMGPLPCEEAERIRMENLCNARSWTDEERAAVKAARDAESGPSGEEHT
jgi:hypothetical protein